MDNDYDAKSYGTKRQRLMLKAHDQVFNSAGLRNTSYNARTIPLDGPKGRTIEGVRGSLNMPPVSPAGITVASTGNGPPGTSSGARKNAKFGSSFPNQFFDVRNSRLQTPFTEQAKTYDFLGKNQGAIRAIKTSEDQRSK